MEMNKDIYIFGHKNPDTDTICSAIAYAWFKNEKTASTRYHACRLGEISTETGYVLDRFGFDAPMLLEDVHPHISDLGISPGERVSRDISIRKAWELMNAKHESTLAVMDETGKLEGLVTVGDVARCIMDAHGSNVISEAGTPYTNIVETLEAEVLAGDIEGKRAQGKVVVAAANPDQMEDFIDPGDIVILGDRYEAQLCALEMQAGCLVVCIGSKVDEKILAHARESGAIILRTGYDTYIASRLMNESIPVQYFMVRDGFMTFRENDTVEEIRGVISKVRHRAFPVMDEKGCFAGMVTRQNILQMKPKQVILVDHNESSQSADGIGQAQILEVIDHHKIGNVEMQRPLLYRAQPVGCTATILYMMFREQNMEIPPGIAGLMCSAILSDTLLYRSPTCTPADIRAARELAQIAGIDDAAHAKAMFKAGSDFSGKSEMDILYQDFKKFSVGETSFGVGQVTSMDAQDLEELAPRMQTFMESSLKTIGVDMSFLMLTDILSESTLFVCAGEQALEKVRDYRNYPEKGKGTLFMENVVSRKKQIIPLLMEALV